MDIAQTHLPALTMAELNCLALGKTKYYHMFLKCKLSGPYVVDQGSRYQTDIQVRDKCAMLRQEQNN